MEPTRFIDLLLVSSIHIGDGRAGASPLAPAPRSARLAAALEYPVYLRA
jgi:hypothetical protein